MIGPVPQRSRVKLWVLVVLVLVLAVVGSVSYLGWRQSVPGVRVTLSAPRFLGQKTTFTVGLAAARGNIVGAEIRVVQGSKTVVVARPGAPLGARVELPVTVESGALGLSEGGATLEVWGRDDFWRPLSSAPRPAAVANVTVDLTPPRLAVLAATRYVSPGGAALVAFRATDAARVDVNVGSRTFPSFPLGLPDRNTRVALIALAHDAPLDTPLTVTAYDEAGNTATRGIASEVRPRRFPRDRLEVQDSMLRVKVPELLPHHPPSQPLIESFLVINRDQRRQAEEEKRRVGGQTAATPLWEGPFLQQRNTKVFANFAETRTYLYGGREIDTQVHFGYDLASTKRAAVAAANRGVVVFAGSLTIYGNTVIIDHGLGLQTLYAHLSSIDVKPGDQVDKGQPIGRTGTTGLAVGDHLHFEVLVSGVSVTPLEWWDPKWIRDRVNGPLLEAGLPPIPG